MLETVPFPVRPSAAGAPQTLGRIVIWPGGEIGQKWIPVARYLQEKTGASISLLCVQPKEQERYQKWWGPLASHVQAIGSLYDDLQAPLESLQALEREAREAERAYGVAMIDLIQADRQLGLAYATGGLSWIRPSRLRDVTYHASLRLALRVLRFFDAYLEEHKPDVILLQGIASLPTKCLAVAARRRGVAIRVPLSRFRNLLFWVGNEFYDMPWLQAAYARQPLNGSAPAPKVEGPYLASAVRRRKRVELLSLRGTLAECWGQLTRVLYQRVRGLEKPGGYRLRDRLAFTLRAYRQHRFWERHSFQDAAALDGARYVLYLLQQEPESSLMVRAPEFNNQAAVIDLIAKSLPADVRLVIKEHQTNHVAARPAGYYDWLARIPNVLLASMHLNSVPLIERSLAMVVITGTAGFEAAALGVPVVSFGRRNFYHGPPHVHVVDRLSEVRPLLARLCEEEPPDARLARVREGQRFISALRSCAVDMDAEQFFTAEAPVSKAKSVQIAELLLASLKEPTA